MSFHEISIAVRAENRASYAFRTIAMDAIHLAYSFGALDSQTGRMLTGIMTAIHLFTSLKAVLATTTAAQTAHNVSMGAGATIQTTLTGATIAHQTSLWALIKAKIAATIATWGLNAALAMKIALLTLGVGLIVATAAYMAWLASTTRDAASAQAEYNAELAKTPTRSIRRAGEEEYYRRGVEY